MTGSDNSTSQWVTEHYWTVLLKYISAVQSGIALSHKIAGKRSESPRQYAASVLFVRLLSAGTSVLHLCPGSPANTAGTHWDFSSLASVVRSLVRTELMLFYLGTEAVEEDESRARLLTMQLCDCTERQHLFQNFGAPAEETRGFQEQADRIRAELSSNRFFARLPDPVREGALKGNRASILTEDQILDRLGILNQSGRAFFRFISSHADVSPLAYYRTGENNRGRGEESDTDKGYTATAIDLARDFIIRAEADMQALFREALAASARELQTSARDERFEHAVSFIRSQEGGHIDELAGSDGSSVPLLCSECFNDEGLRLSAARIGQRDMSKCPNCGSQIGMKLSQRSIATLAQEFFVRGTVRRLEYGAYPVVQFNRRQSTSIHVAPGSSRIFG